MAEYILDRAEFLVLLDAMNASAVVGFDPQELFPNSRDQHRQLVEHGQQLLQQQGLLRPSDDGTQMLDRLLATVAAIVARPEVAFVSVREIPDVGRQLFLHYQKGNFVVEQTLPQERQHRLATLPNLDALFERLLAIFPVDADPVSEAVCYLSEEQFLAAKAQAEQGQVDDALALFVQPTCPAAEAQLLIEALAHPRFSGTIALLRCSEEQVIDARNPAIVQGPQSAWSISQVVPGEPRFQIVRINAARLREQLETWFRELVGAVAA